VLNTDTWPMIVGSFDPVFDVRPKSERESASEPSSGRPRSESDARQIKWQVETNEKRSAFVYSLKELREELPSCQQKKRDFSRSQRLPVFRSNVPFERPPILDRQVVCIEHAFFSQFVPDKESIASKS